jgi:hypothetical protein
MTGEDVFPPSVTLFFNILYIGIVFPLQKCVWELTFCHNKSAVLSSSNIWSGNYEHSLITFCSHSGNVLAASTFSPTSPPDTDITKTERS